MAQDTKYNPMDEAFWTLPMVLVWIAARDVDRVTDVMDATLQVETFDIPIDPDKDRRPRGGYKTTHPWRPGALLMYAQLILCGERQDTEGAEKAEMEYEKAEGELRKALLGGGVGKNPVALEAVPSGKDAPETVSASALRRLKWRDDSNEIILFYKNDLKPSFDNGPVEPAYRDPVFRRSQVLACWKQKTKAVKKRADTQEVKGIIKRSLTYHMKNDPDNNARLSKRAIFKRAVKEFGDKINQKAFEAVWCEVTGAVPCDGWIAVGSRGKHAPKMAPEDFFAIPS